MHFSFKNFPLFWLVFHGNETTCPSKTSFVDSVCDFKSVVDDVVTLICVNSSLNYPVLSLVRSKAPNQQLDLQVKGDRWPRQLLAEETLCLQQLSKYLRATNYSEGYST